MKFCPNCSTPLDDNAKYCTTCGAVFEPVEQAAPAQEVKKTSYSGNGDIPFTSHFTQSAQNQSQTQPPPPPVSAEPYDHTAEFDAKDISDNKVIAMLLYLMGTVGVLIALLSQNNSPYVAFHLRQALKIMVINALVTLVTAVFCWTYIVPAVGAIAIVVITVIKIICFVDICKGKSKEPPIICKLNFLK